MGELKIGSVVTLKSGGEKMTIESLGQYNDATCVWFMKSDNGYYTGIVTQDIQLAVLKEV